MPAQRDLESRDAVALRLPSRNGELHSVEDTMCTTVLDALQIRDGDPTYGHRAGELLALNVDGQLGNLLTEAIELRVDLAGVGIIETRDDEKELVSVRTTERAGSVVR